MIKTLLRSLSRRAAWTVLLAGAALPALAHHSFAMFDSTRKVTVTGTVKEFQMVNPHTWLQLVADDPVTHMPVEWSIEFGSVGILARAGFRPTTLKPGDKISVEFNPLKNGKPGGSFIALTLADGTKMGGGAPDALPGSPAPAGGGQ